MIKWLISQGYCNESCVKAAVRENQLEIIEYIYQINEGVVFNICNIAIECGNIKILKWGLSKGYKITTLSA